MSRKLNTLAALMTTSLIVAVGPAFAQEADSCHDVRIAAGEWPDIQITSAIMEMITEALGYDTDITTLTIPVVYASLKNNDVDVWMGNWMPSQTTELQPYLDDKSVEVLGVNLAGAQSSIAVPSYVAEAGVTSFKDLAGNADKFGSRVYGFEAGNDVNRHVQALIDDPANGLTGWTLVESSEAGMVTEAEKAIENKEWIIFLPYTPHAAMGKMDLHFLSDIPDASFGEATVYTNVRAGYLTECPNVGGLFKNVSFSIEMLTDLLAYQETERSRPEQTAENWVLTHQDDIQPWLAGVTTIDGGDAFEALLAAYPKP
ncbi:glycine betaine ABC transporter substrate-binding protein [Pseudogemmobacter humi]|uniref:Glycine betaine-binding protein OpuAC n=1 Tax=Pseudogemmobacter humi TaxID=2483812 RepID=A0A3P5WF88_9RHOB|nr:glycine betaine ABC transporter substrate-binding protein [Pseudogemmobacter humi]VDC19219.1 Glycine betaine-binding protein OpuAC precursor [Pseudogemmobacter humi]